MSSLHHERYTIAKDFDHELVVISNSIDYELLFRLLADFACTCDGFVKVGPMHIGLSDWLIFMAVTLGKRHYS